jgi:hypothetical protein
MRIPLRLVCRGLALLPLALGGCGATIPDPFAPSGKLVLTGNPAADLGLAVSPVLATLGKYTSADVDAALTDAEAQAPPDAVAIACWTTVKAALPILSLPPGAAGAMAIQKARDTQTVAPQVARNCAGIIPFAGALP